MRCRPYWSILVGVPFSGLLFALMMWRGTSSLVNAFLMFFCYLLLVLWVVIWNMFESSTPTATDAIHSGADSLLLGEQRLLTLRVFLVQMNFLEQQLSPGSNQLPLVQQLQEELRQLLASTERLLVADLEEPEEASVDISGLKNS